jgi:hypothetical protein
LIAVLEIVGENLGDLGNKGEREVDMKMASMFAFCMVEENGVGFWLAGLDLQAFFLDGGIAVDGNEKFR